MGFSQTLTPNPSVPCTPGLCLKYVSDAFGITGTDANGKQVSLIPHTNYPSATAAWNASIQHQDQNFPAGMWVPVWFSLRDEPDGHVAIMAPDGAVWSSSHPTKTSALRHPSLAALINYYANANPLTYLGWSEDIGGTAVITPEGGEQMALLTQDQVLWHYRLIAGLDPSPSELQSYTGKEYVSATEEIKRYFANAGQGYNVYKQTTDKMIADLKAQIDTAKASTTTSTQQLTQAQTDLSTSQASLKTEQDKSAGLAKNLNDSQLALQDANDQLKQAESLASDDDAKIKDLTAKLSDAQAQIDQLKAQADKPPANLTSTDTSTPQTDSTHQNLLSNLLGALVSFMGSSHLRV